MVNEESERAKDSKPDKITTDSKPERGVHDQTSRRKLASDHEAPCAMMGACARKRTHGAPTQHAVTERERKPPTVMAHH